MAKLTVKQLQALSEKNYGQVVRDDGGLFGKVKATKSGMSVSFYYRYRWEGKSHDFSCGTWPNKSIGEIRSQRDRARHQLSEGENPSKAKQAAKLEKQARTERIINEAKLRAAKLLTVQDLFEEWISEGVARKDNNKELNRRFKKDVLPLLGRVPLNNLNDKAIRDMLRRITKRGCNRLAVSLYKDFNQMILWGEKRKPWRKLLVDGNPAQLVDMKNLLGPDYQEQRNRVLSTHEITELNNIFMTTNETYQKLPAGAKYKGHRPLDLKSQIAVWLCLSTLCRVGELLQAEWKDVDLRSGVWFIPSDNTKTKADHFIFLSDFSLRNLEKLKELTGHTPFLFPSRNKQDKAVDPKSISKSIGDRQSRFKKKTKALSNRRHDNSLVLSHGINGKWTPHDLRRTGATMMQALGIGLDIIDRCQNHVIAGSKIRRHYLHHSYEKEKRHAWQQLGRRLDEVLNNTNVIQLHA